MTGEEAEKFEEDIGMRTSPEAVALAALRAHQEASGMAFDDPDAPVAAPLGSRDEEIPGAWMGR
jgi:hypothetical protein